MSDQGSRDARGDPGDPSPTATPAAGDHQSFPSLSHSQPPPASSPALPAPEQQLPLSVAPSAAAAAAAASSAELSVHGNQGLLSRPLPCILKKKGNAMDNSSVAPRLLPFHILEEITNGFSKDRKLGAGSYGDVYKGVYEGGETIAVKVLHYIPGLDDELFEKEYLNLATLHHKHIVRLVGYSYETHRECLPYKGKMVFAEMTKRALCFEYMPNGSLDKFLSEQSSGHDWFTRYAIIKGICEGIQYLHEELHSPMYHLDLKPGNVLLDENMAPKIADFGLSRFYGDEKTKITKSSFGTPGYLPPEYIDSGIVSDKFDIFSLGVVIIKIMIGRTGYFRSAEMSPEQFIELVHANWKGRLQTTSLYESYSEQAKGCIELALACVDADRHKRPSIGVIINKLNQTETIIQLLEASRSNTRENELETLNSIATVNKGDAILAADVPSTLEATTVHVGGVESYDNVAVEKLLLDGAVISYIPPVQIVIVTVGTRGEVQPFVAIGKRLQDYGHRVRLATHAKYKEFVLTAGLEFFPLFGDPNILTGYVMKNRGFLDRGSLKPIERKEMKDSMFSLLPACKDPDPDTGIPFRVGAIIANPLAHDWGPKTDVVGFCFLDLASDYIPSESLVKWLEAGGKPIYVGFGSLAQERWRKRLHKTVKGTSVRGYCQQVKECLEIALNCVDPDRRKRPSIAKIVHMLNETEQSLTPQFELVSASDQLLDVHPLELSFPSAVSLGGVPIIRKKKVAMASSSSCSLQLQNKGDDRVAFMLVASNPKRYLTKKPLYGIVPPRCAYTLTLTMPSKQKQPPRASSTSSDNGGDFFTLYSIMLGGYDLLDAAKDSSKYDNFFKKAKESTASAREDDTMQEVTLKAICDRPTDQGTSSRSEIITMPDAQQVSSIDVHPTEPWIMTTNHVGILRVWDYHTMAALNSFQLAAYEPVHAAKFIARKKIIVAGDRDGGILVYNYENEAVHSFDAHDSCVTTLAVHSTSPFVLSSSEDDDHLIKLWDWDNDWKCTREFGGHIDRVTQVTFNPENNDSFASASWDGMVKIWSICSDDPGKVITLKLDGRVLCADYFTRYKRQHLIMGCEDKAAQVWALGIKGHVDMLEGHEDPITAVKLHPELPLLMTGSLDGTVRIWDSTTYTPENIIGFNLGEVYSFGCIKGSTRIVVGCHQGIATMELSWP